MTSETRLAPRIVIVLSMKILVLVLLWVLFVRDQRVSVDARGVASAFGLTGVQVPPRAAVDRDDHGQ